jgi:hypothetical protein
MVSFQGPDVAQVTYKPVIDISDSKKFDDGVTLKVAGTNGSTEFAIDDVVTIYVYLKDYLQAKGINPELEASANRLLDKSFLSSANGTDTTTY